jgi:hypothetical protein
MNETRVCSIGGMILAEETRIDLMDCVSFITWYGGSSKSEKFPVEFIFMALQW